MKPDVDIDYYQSIKEEDVFDSPVLNSKLPVKSSVKLKTTHQKRMSKWMKLKATGHFLLRTTRNIITIEYT